MIAMLRGRVFSRGDDHVVLDVHGVGYLVRTTPQTAQQLPDDADVLLYVATLVREDAITLYGFTDPQKREAFDVLRVVNGVGPKLGMAILSHMSLAALANAIASGNAVAIKGVKGIGMKIAERICLELAGKFDAVTLPEFQPRLVEADPLPLALARLDYKRSEIERAMASGDVPRPGDAPLDQRIKAALKILAGNV